MVGVGPEESQHCCAWPLPQRRPAQFPVNAGLTPLGWCGRLIESTVSQRVTNTECGEAATTSGEERSSTSKKDLSDFRGSVFSASSGSFIIPASLSSVQ